MKEITQEYLQHLAIEHKKVYCSDVYTDHIRYQWVKVGDDIDMHITLEYNCLYNYYETTIDEFIRGYHAGHTQMSTKIRYVEELEMILNIMKYKFKSK